MIEVDTQLSFKNIRLQHAFSVKGNRTVLFGSSGAGKSVLLKMIAGFFDPDHGRIATGSRVLFDSASVINIPVHKRRIGYLPQEYTLFPNMNVIDNILYGIRVQKKTPNKQWLDYLLTKLEIGDLKKRDPGSLSGGQQQRVALARLLVIRPDILLLDEPFTALDSAIRESLRDMVIELVDEMNILTILVTHDLDEAFIFARELVLVKEGQIVESGSRDVLYRHPRYVESARLLGFSNIFPAEEVGDGYAVLPNGHRFHFNGGFSPSSRFFCIRPEHIMIHRERNSQQERKPANLLKGTIQHIFHHGRYVKLVIRTASDLSFQISIPVHVHDKLTLSKGNEINVFLKEEAIVMCESKYEREP